MDGAWHIPWEQLSAEYIGTVSEYVAELGPEVLSQDLFRCLRATQRLQALGSAVWPHFEKKLDAFLRVGCPADDAAGLVVSEIERCVLSGAASNELILVSDRIANRFWQDGKPGAALNLATALTLVGPQAKPPSWLREVAGNVPGFTGLALVRAANLLRRYPHTDWVIPLKTAWVNIDQQLHAQHESESKENTVAVIRAMRERNTPTLHAAASVAVALGVAAGCDADYTALEEPPPESQELEQLIGRRNGLVDEHAALRMEYHKPGLGGSRRKEIEERIRQIQVQIRRMDASIEQLRKRLRAGMSAGRLLLLVLQDEQSYPASVRQAAAWGLFKLCERGHLDKDSRSRIQSMIDRATFDRDEDALVDAIRDLHMQADVESFVVAEAQRYLELPSWPRFTAALDTLRLDPDLYERILSLIGAFAAQPSHQFQERVVQFSAGQGFLEMEHAVLDSMVWMLDLVEKGEDDRDDSEQDQGQDDSGDYSAIRDILRLTCEHVPGALAFLGEYPLRLMTSKQHAQIMGKYSRTKAGITHWTRYTPPLWKPGAPPDQIGTVIKRYIEMDDRSAPNAMGISFRLFAHPVLAVPVIFHEFMHYGGPTGDPGLGIEGECEVHLREAIFTLGMIAKLAPRRDEDIPAYERKLAAQIKRCGLPASFFERLVHLSDRSGVMYLNQEIEDSYGPGMSEEAARAQIERIIGRQNIEIQLMNAVNEMKLAWQPEIEWPYMNTEQTRAVSDSYYKVLFRSLTTSQLLSPEEYAVVLEDPALAQFREDWDAYLRRRAGGGSSRAAGA
jgi:hypothetical protein